MKTLYLNDVDYDVYLAKLALSRALSEDFEFSDVYTKDFENYVVDFQRAKNLTPDGIFGPATWQAALPFLYGFTIHKIEDGDTFKKLAEYYSTSEEKIKRANPDITPTNLQIGSKIVIPYNFPLVTDKVPFSYTLTQYTLYGLVARYPFLELTKTGNSIMGKSIYVVKIGRGPKEFFYNGSHHANEWITTPLLLKFLEEYSDSYISNKNIGDFGATFLYNTSTLYVVPLVNPDGVDLVNKNIDFDSEYYVNAQEIANNYPSISFPEGWKANIAGTDLNLNYPAFWEEAKRIKSEQGFTSPAPRDFVGGAPLSAVESKSIYDFTLKHNFYLTISYHTQGEIIYWKFLDYNPENSYEIALEFAKSSGYSVSETPMASGYAGYKDWFILNYNLPGYTIEVGKGINPLPIEQLNDIYNRNIGILTYALSI